MILFSMQINCYAVRLSSAIKTNNKQAVMLPNISTPHTVDVAKELGAPNSQLQPHYET